MNWNDSLKGAQIIGVSFDGNGLVLDLPAVEAARFVDHQPEGSFVGSVQVTISIDRLREFARRALINKNGKASVGTGMVHFGRCDDVRIESRKG